MIPGEQWDKNHRAYLRYTNRLPLEICAWSLALMLMIHWRGFAVIGILYLVRVIWMWGKVRRLNQRVITTLRQRQQYIAESYALQSHSGEPRSVP